MLTHAPYLPVKDNFVYQGVPDIPEYHSFRALKSLNFFKDMTRSLIYVAANAVLLLLGLSTGSCGNGTNKNIPDVSDIAVQVNLQRFDQDLFSLDTTNWDEGLRVLEQNYPDFLPFFIAEIAHDQSNADETPLEAIAGFVAAPQVQRLRDSCQAAFPDLALLQADLEQMLRFYRYHLPNRPLPRFVTAVTEFIGDAYAVNDTLLLIGLDMFLGEDFPGYNPDYFPQYLRKQFVPEYMTTKIALALSSRLVGPPPGERVVDYMINNGKVLYLLDALLPMVPDSMKMGYTQDQLEGCHANEQGIWARLLELKVLYEPLNNKNQKIVMPSPSTDIVFQETPGEVGNWIGWQIVRAYMRRYPETSMEELLAFRDTQQFLGKAKYKPKRVN
ncbi:MAG: hypothetical protein IPM98_21240 [Lewinellaceae bacterium]|nr:hypothetical protein [Lewinellaceae bacterium]